MNTSSTRMFSRRVQVQTTMIQASMDTSGRPERPRLIVSMAGDHLSMVYTNFANIYRKLLIIHGIGWCGNLGYPIPRIIGKTEKKLKVQKRLVLTNLFTLMNDYINLCAYSNYILYTVNNLRIMNSTTYCKLPCGKKIGHLILFFWVVTFFLDLRLKFFNTILSHSDELSCCSRY